ncbi:MAG: tRNA (adenosine(37)-N6)-threonylcarbamoyltransferase complex ATPase subunit type 1 TsaE [Actinobacteria bacterium]|nr:tRNA (adenosine(37)-N6)-threonylcarbamoyltransferase complex ATPase subunit type 1 TsaE [Actinomycetota bacterium]
MRDLAATLAAACRGGDLIVLIGDLGAGKTTFVQGLGRGLGVSEAVTSPTFVISRVHEAAGGIGLVHVDAYRLGSAVDLDDLDLDVTLADCVTVVEWGEGKAEHLSPNRLDVRIDRSDDADDEVRLVTITGHGERWPADAVAALESRC